MSWRGGAITSHSTLVKLDVHNTCLYIFILYFEYAFNQSVFDRAYELDGSVKN